MKKTPARFIRRIIATVLLAALFTLMNVSAQPVSGTWNNASSGGAWSSSGNWVSGIIANGAGSTADFSTLNITADNTVHLDSARTLTVLKFGDTTTGSAAGWFLDNTGNSANTLTLSNGFVQVNTLGAGKVATISVILVGTNLLTKSGPGTLVLSSANTYSGNTVISAGTLTLSGSGAINNSPTVSVANGATFNVSTGGYTVSAGHTLTGAGSVLSGTVTVASGGMLAPGDAGVGTLTTSNLTLNNGATNNFEFSATGTNDMVSAATLTLNGGVVINLYQTGSTTPFTQSGTYNLFQFSGVVAGAGILSVGNPQPGVVYTFNNSPGTGIISLAITNTPLPPAASTLSVHSIDGSILAVHFGGQVQSASANNPTNYSVYSKVLSSTGVNVTNAVLLSDEQTVVLYVDTPVSEFFAVGVSNVLDLSSNNIAANATGYLGDLFSTSIGTSGDPAIPGSVIGFYRDAFQVTASGSNIGGANDHCQFIYQNNVGNFDAAVNIASLTFANAGTKAFLMARETTDSSARSVAIGFTALDSIANTNQVLIFARSVSNSAAQPFGTPPQLNSLGWLRMTRASNTFTVYYGSNGFAWTPCGTFTNSFSSTMSVGIALTSHDNSSSVTAGVNSFGLAGTLPGTGIVPTLSMSIYSNNLVAKWQRTPRDFMVQVTDNLSSTTGVSNSSPTWTYVLLPVFDTSLTGTNAFMSTPGRYMSIPMDLFSRSAMYVRLTQVERVIPDPQSVTPGLILSQPAGNMVANNPAGSLGGYTVNSVGSVAIQVTNYLALIPTNNYTFTTDNSTNLFTVMVIKRMTNISGIASSIPVATNAGVGFAGKARISLLASATNYTAIIAATNNYTPTTNNPIRLRIDYQ